MDEDEVSSECCDRHRKKSVVDSSSFKPFMSADLPYCKHKLPSNTDTLTKGTFCHKSTKGSLGITGLLNCSKLTKNNKNNFPVKKGNESY